MDLTSYAGLAVRLVNTAAADGSDADLLGSTDAFRAFVAGDAYLSGPCTHHDLDALRVLRAELGAVFAAAAERDHAAAAGRLNALLIQYPARPKLAHHGRSSRWHLHLDESGSVADRYGAGAVAGLAMIVSQLGMSHLGVCALPACRNVFVDPGRGRSNRYCADHCANKANVTAFRDHRRSADGYSASTAAG